MTKNGPAAQAMGGRRDPFVTVCSASSAALRPGIRTSVDRPGGSLPDPPSASGAESLGPKTRWRAGLPLGVLARGKRMGSDGSLAGYAVGRREG
jgi:hypothetical protein